VHVASESSDAGAEHGLQARVIFERGDEAQHFGRRGCQIGIVVGDNVCLSPECLGQAESHGLRLPQVLRQFQK